MDLTFDSFSAVQSKFGSDLKGLHTSYRWILIVLRRDIIFQSGSI